MAAIFKSRRQTEGFIILIIILAALFWLLSLVFGFEKERYDLDHKNYLKNTADYAVTEAEIVDQKIYNGANDESLRYIDVYFTNIVEVTFAGGQTMRFRTPLSPGDKIGGTVGVAYNKQFDTNYDEYVQTAKNEDKSGVMYLTLPRTQTVTNHIASTVVIGLIALFFIITIVYVVRCYKKPAMFSY